MRGSRAGTVIGAERAESLEVHEARSAVRRLAAGVFDAWDGGDGAALAAAGTANARWSGPADAPAEALVDGYACVRRDEPWSRHWIGNETVRIDGDTARGTWLWHAASLIHGGATSAWSGGDLTLDAMATPAGWRITELALSDRYRTPVDVGWLEQLHASPAPFPSTGAVSAEVPVSSAELGLAPPPPPPAATSGTDEERLDALGAEVEIRSLMGEHIDGTEHAAPAAELVERWTPDGSYRVEDAAARDAAIGRHEIAALLDDQAAAEPSWIRTLTNEWILVAGARATARWRDLATVEVDGTARWRAHQYLVELVREDGRWRFDRVVRRRLLDAAYGTPWNGAAGGGA
ncbi:MAG: SnoaL-like domain [Acidimicrobiales bacterium]|nr:SnoaL-like domain [Acidimicrobiales bacterium]